MVARIDMRQVELAFQKWQRHGVNKSGRWLAVSLLMALPSVWSPAAAQAPLSAQLANCLGIFGAVERLACYDRVAHGVAPAVAAVPYAASPAPANPRMPVPAYPAPQPAQPAGQPLAGALTNQFGGERLPEAENARPARLDRISAAITSFTLDPRGKFILALANGQVWRQVESDDTIARPRKSARSVTIARGLFNSYDLVFNDAPQKYKVIREQ
jgi:hypothetical protein